MKHLSSLLRVYEDVARTGQRLIGRLLGPGAFSVRDAGAAIAGLLRGAGEMLLDLAFRRAGTTDAGTRVERVLAHHVALRTPDSARKFTAYVLGAAQPAQEALSADRLDAMARRAQARLTTIADTEVTNLNALATVGAFRRAGSGLFVPRGVLDERTTATCHASPALVLDPSRPVHRHAFPAYHWGCRTVVEPAGRHDLPSTDAAVERFLEIQRQEFPTWTPHLTHLLGMVA